MLSDTLPSVLYSGVPKKLAAMCYDVARELEDALTSCSSLTAVSYNPLLKQAYVQTDDATSDTRGLIGSLVPLACKPNLKNGCWVKVAFSPSLRRLGVLLNYFPGYYFGSVHNSHGPIQAAIASGLLGAGLGYGAGAVAETFLPDDWRGVKNRWATLGGALGATALPGAWMYANYANKLPLTSRELLSHMTPEAYDHTYPSLAKSGSDDDLGFSSSGAFGDDLGFKVDSFNKVVWQDPRVANSLPPSTQLLASGLVSGASGRSNSNGWVTPADIANMAVGMGAGYASGAILGKGLGILMNAPVPAQHFLRNTGLWAGAVKSFVGNTFN